MGFIVENKTSLAQNILSLYPTPFLDLSPSRALIPHSGYIPRSLHLALTQIL